MDRKARQHTRPRLSKFDAAELGRLIGGEAERSDPLPPEHSDDDDSDTAIGSDTVSTRPDTPAKATPGAANPAESEAGEPAAGSQPRVTVMIQPEPVNRGRSAAVDRSLTRRTMAVKSSSGRRKTARRLPNWLLVGACGASALLTVLFASLLPGPSAPEAERPRGKASPSPRGSLPTFESDFAEHPPSRSGVKPMDAQEQARRREGMASFGEMGRAEEEKLRQEQAAERASVR